MDSPEAIWVNAFHLFSFPIAYCYNLFVRRGERSGIIYLMRQLSGNLLQGSCTYMYVWPTYNPATFLISSYYVDPYPALSYRYCPLLHAGGHIASNKKKHFCFKNRPTKTTNKWYFISILTRAILDNTYNFLNF